MDTHDERAAAGPAGAAKEAGSVGAAALPADWARRPPPGWILSGGWGTARWPALPRKTRLRLWHLARVPAAAVERN